MTVNNALRTKYTAGNGSLTAMPYDFRILADTHLFVVLTDAAGVDTTQVLGTDYTVAGVKAATGGTVEMTVAPATGETLKIERVLPLTQDTDLRNSGLNFTPEGIEDALDYQLMVSQQVAATADQSAPTVYTTAARPVASSLWAGKTIRIVDSGTPGLRQVCEVSTDGTTYTWVTIATGDL